MRKILYIVCISTLILVSGVERGYSLAPEVGKDSCFTKAMAIYWGWNRYYAKHGVPKKVKSTEVYKKEAELRLVEWGAKQEPWVMITTCADCHGLMDVKCNKCMPGTMPSEPPKKIGVSSGICGTCLERQYKEEKMLTESKKELVTKLKFIELMRLNKVDFVRAGDIVETFERKLELQRGL